MLSTRPADSPSEQPAAATGQVPKRELLNTLLAHLAGESKGREALAKVFLWLYKGGPCIKSAITSAVGRDWDYVFLENEQKERIESRIDPTMFDKQLLFFLLKNTCGLSDAYEGWDIPGDTLEYLLGIIYQGPPRNTSPKERVITYEGNISEMLKKAAYLSGTDPNTVEDILTETRQYFDLIKGMIESEPETVPISLVSAIVDLLSNMVKDGRCGDLTDYLLCAIEESNQDESVVQLVVDLLKKCDQWTLAGDMVNGLGLVLDHVVPERVNLWFDSNPSPSRVQPVLEDLSKRNVEVDLYTSSRSDEGASYLKALTGPGSLCKVTSCQGFVSASTAAHLPASVTSLTISTDFQSLQALATALARLEDLDWFYLKVTDNTRPAPETMPLLPTPFMYIDSPQNLSSEDVPWWCHAARQMSPCGRYAFMEVSLMKGEDTELLIQQLHERGMWVEYLNADYCTSDTTIDHDQLHNLALELGISDRMCISPS
ncbi:uncharacterized protein LOC122254581 isoform X2 [Penaeus japonicus]|uniref:uncharacterized protein LOC122254581 isoform X2 n=1 Tax=Penaeus japonicus TaxID=27405 RepID=UPI001C716CF6|nr:uncharacterized protein LOC122254581 isoform X2 [Penaeus japonicus]